MSEYFSKNYSKTDPIIMLGDINIAPLEHDVWSHKQLLSVVSHTPIEVEKLNNLQKTLNWVDSHRLFVPNDQKLYSWWSYRALDPIASNRGRRLDHIWITPVLKKQIKAANILKEFRTEAQPSDHVPITIEFAL
jgi:exodeoxyribonuclease-3